MTENDRLADEVVLALQRAILALLTYKQTSEQFLIRLQHIMKAANL